MTSHHDVQDIIEDNRDCTGQTDRESERERERDERSHPQQHLILSYTHLYLCILYPCAFRYSFLRDACMGVGSSSGCDVSSSDEVDMGVSCNNEERLCGPERVESRHSFTVLSMYMIRYDMR